MKSNDTYEWTSECVGPGHPDKVADQISDGILDAYLAVDPKSRVAVETLVKGKLVVLAGEITSKETVDYEAVVNQVYQDLGYDPSELVFTKAITEQSPQIAGAVGDQNEGAGDQGIMFGYATNETPDYMPLTLSLARRVERAPERHKKDSLSIASFVAKRLKTDRKTQVTAKFDQFDRPLSISKIVFSSHHSEDMTLEMLQRGITDILKEELEETGLFTTETQLLINPAGLWTFGGPEADAGLTGRKIVVDNYGADCPIGGGCYCFASGTQVRLSNGTTKPIENMAVGDVVLTVNEKTGLTETKEVFEVHQNTVEESEQLLELELENGEKILVTDNHEFMTKRGWVRAGDLTCEDELIQKEDL